MNGILSKALIAVRAEASWRALHKASIACVLWLTGRHRLVSLHHCGGGIMVRNDSDLVIDEIGYHFARV